MLCLQKFLLLLNHFKNILELGLLVYKPLWFLKDLFKIFLLGSIYKSKIKQYEHKYLCLDMLLIKFQRRMIILKLKSQI